MPLIPIKIPWATKPPLGTPIDWSNPLTQGLVGAWAFNEGGGNPFNSVDNAALVKVGTGGVWTPQGLGFNRSTSDYYYTPNITAFVLPFTVLSLFSGDRTSSVASSICGLDKRWCINYETYANAGFGYTKKGSQDVASSFYPTDNQITTAAIVALADNTAISYTPTAQVLSAAGAYSNVGTPNKFIIGGSTGTNGSLGDMFNGTIGILLYFTRALSPAEIASLSTNPWQIYQPQTIWVPTAVASAGWAKKIFGISPAKVQGISSADIAKVLGV